MLFRSIFNMNPNSSAPATVDVRLPENALPVGEPVYFERYSWKLTPGGWRAVESIVAEMKRSGRQRVTLVASADAVDGESANVEVSKRRGQAVEAALVERGIVVQSVLSVGESLARDDTPRELRSKFRKVCAYSTELPRGADIGQIR